MNGKKKVSMPAWKKVFVIELLLLACVGCSRQNPRILPGELAGFWTTNASHYENRSLELSGTYVIIGTGLHEASVVQMIDKVEVEQIGSDATYTIYSTDLQGVHYQMAIRYSPVHGGEITFKNQPTMVWRRPADKAAAFAESNEQPPAR
jgi:hypothetical protein